VKEGRKVRRTGFGGVGGGGGGCWGGGGGGLGVGRIKMGGTKKGVKGEWREISGGYCILKNRGPFFIFQKSRELIRAHVGLKLGKGAVRGKKIAF